MSEREDCKLKKGCFALVIIVFIFVLLTGCNKESESKHNNDKSISELITQKYSKSDIESMKKGIEEKTLDYSKLKSNYNIQCLRKTNQGYYALFLQDDGARVFVFMNEKMELSEVLVVDDIKRKNEFDFIEIGITTESQVMEFDRNTFLLPISSADTTVHFVQEGLLVITYSRFNEGTQTILDDSIVKSITFYDNADFPLTDDVLINLNVPYILEIDKLL